VRCDWRRVGRIARIALLLIAGNCGSAVVGALPRQAASRADPSPIGGWDSRRR
jgi:hypothetical protein